MSDREVNSQQRKTSLLRQTFEQTALASHAPETARPDSGRCHALVGVATVPWALAPGENSLRLTFGNADKIIDVVKDSRRDQNQAIKTIQ